LLNGNFKGVQPAQLENWRLLKMATTAEVTLTGVKGLGNNYGGFGITGAVNRRLLHLR